jgi:hypothetical protein
MSMPVRRQEENNDVRGQGGNNDKQNGCRQGVNFMDVLSFNRSSFSRQKARKLKLFSVVSMT